MPFSETENKGSVKEPDKKGASAPARKTAAGTAAKSKAPSAKKQADKAMPAKSARSTRTVYHKGEGAKPAAAKTSKKPTTKAADKKQADVKSAAAKTAAAAAREEAVAKRSRAARNDGPTGSIFAAAVAEGTQTAELPAITPAEASGAVPAENPRATGSIFAAAVREGVAVWEEEADGVVRHTEAHIEEAEVVVVEEASAAVAAEAGQALTELAGLEEDAPVAKATTGELPVFKRRERARAKAQKKKRGKNAGATTSFPANRGEGGNVVFRTIGGLLYALGFYTESKLIFAWRFVRDLGIFIGQILVWAFGGIVRSIGRFFVSIIQDFLAPFRRAGNEFRQRQDAARHKAQNPGSEMVVYTSSAARQRHKARNLLGVLVPVAAVAALVFVVYSVFGMQYALAVQVDGETIGYITDRTVLEDAKNIIRDRLRFAEGQSQEDVQFNFDLNIEKTAVFTSKDQIANKYLMSNYGDAAEGTGLRIDGLLFAATTDGDALADFLQEKKDASFDPDMPDAEIGFVSEVELEPEGAYINDTFQDIEALEETLNSTVVEEASYVARGEETLADIAGANGISPDALRASNEAIAGEGDDFIPAAGTELVIQTERPFLQIKKTVRQKVEEVIPFESVEEETDEYTIGYRFTIQAGVEGQREACYDYTYIDGELVSQDLVAEETTVLSEPVNELIMVGTAEPVSAPAIANGLNPNITGSGDYIFPVPDWLYSSRGVSSGHRGRDINAAHGAPIYACKEGVVVEAGWHYSWGNHVKILHPDGYTTLYAHASALFVTTGQVVSQGQHIAAIGSTGFSFGDHLHLEVWAPGGGLCDPDNFVFPPGGWR